MHKDIRVVLALIAVFGFTSLAQAETIGYWQLNEKAPGQQATGAADEIVDSSGNGHHGYAWASVTLPSYTAATYDPTSALTFSIEGDNAVVIPSSTDFDLMLGDLMDYTIEAVVRTSNLDQIGGIFANRGVTGAGYGFRIREGHMALYIEGVANDGYNFIYPDAMSTSVVADGEWHHIAVVIDANADPSLTAATFYLDGVADGTTTFTSTVYDPSGYPWVNENIINSGDLLIGDFINREQDQFEGDIDLVRFSTGVLTPAEFVQAQVTTPIPGDANGDQKVDGSDVTILAGNWQVGVDGVVEATWAMGDFNGDKKVDGSDVTILAGNWQTGVTAATAAVPEPSSMLLILSAIAAVLIWKRTK